MQTLRTAGPVRTSAPRVLLALALVVLPALVLSIAHAGSYTEDFTTSALKDTIHTTADWDTTAGNLKLFPFEPVLAGSLSSTVLSVSVDGDFAFTARGTSGIWILDISNPASPTPVGNFDTPGVANDVAVSGDYAFVADGGFGLQILDITNPANPGFLGNYDTPGNAVEVRLQGAYAFVADATGGLQIINVSLPTFPVLAGSCSTVGPANGLDLTGDYALVAAGDSGLQIVYIVDPSNPYVTGFHDTPGYAFGVDVEDDLAFIADSDSGIQIVDWYHPTPILVGAYDTPGYAKRVEVAGDLAFVADDISGLQIIDVSNTASPTLWASYDTPAYACDVAWAGDFVFVADDVSGLKAIRVTNRMSPALLGSYVTPDLARRVTVEDDHAFVADRHSGLQIIDISNPASPTLTGSLSLSENVWDVAVQTGYVFLANDSHGLQIIAAGNRAFPTTWSSYDTPGGAYGVDVLGNYAYVADYGSGLQIVDISNRGAPSLAGSYDTPGTAFGVDVVWPFAFVADGSQGLQIINVANPASPALLSTCDTPGNAWDVVVAGDFAFVPDHTAGLQVIDISNLASPTIAGTCNTPGLATGVAVAGDFAYVADDTSGLQIIDISNPYAPTLVDSYNPHTLRCVDVAVAGEHVYAAACFSGVQAFLAYQHQLDAARNTGQSIEVDGANDVMPRVRLTATQTSGVAWALSADGTTNWQGVAPGSGWTRMDSLGADLRWRTTHICSSAGSNPTVSEMTLDWLTESAPITSITDVPGDQGGWVRVTVDRSGYDFSDEDSLQITGYQVYQRVDAQTAAVVRGLSVAAEVSPDAGVSFRSFAPSAVRRLGDRMFVMGSAVSPTAASSFPAGTWEAVGWVAATQSDTYTLRVSTTGDSTALNGIDWTVCLVTTHTTSPSVWFASPPDSGYSVDNIAPGVPEGLAAVYGQSGVLLSWDPAPELDFQYYRIYRSTDCDFEPGSTTLVHATSETSWQDSPEHPEAVCYKVTAVDHAGNESGAASSGAVTAVGDDRVLPSSFALLAAVPNPYRDRTRITFDLPRDTRVSLTVYDVGGHLVRRLVSEDLPAGRHEVQWDGADDSGRRAAAGVYLYRLSAGDFTASRRVVLMR